MAVLFLPIISEVRCQAAVAYQRRISGKNNLLPVTEPERGCRRALAVPASVGKLLQPLADDMRVFRSVDRSQRQRYWLLVPPVDKLQRVARLGDDAGLHLRLRKDGLG